MPNPETYAIPVPVLTPPPVPEIDEEFETYDEGSDTESDEELDALPPLPPPRRNDTVNQNEVLQASGDLFFRHFAAVWWCSVVLRVVGIIIYLGAGLSCLAMLLSVYGLFAGGGSEDLPPGLQAFGGVAMIAMWLLVILIQITVGSIFYAAAQLVTAQSWRYLQHGIGGNGLL